VESEPARPPERRNSIPHHRGNHSQVTTTCVSVDSKPSRKSSRKSSRKESVFLSSKRTIEDDESQLERNGSTDFIIPNVELTELGRVYQKTTIEITHEPARRDMDLSPSNSISGPGRRPPSRWGKKLPPLPPGA